jgi:DsbC/DsbD-like thiol-disulfide interchange protein
MIKSQGQFKLKLINSSSGGLSFFAFIVVLLLSCNQEFQEPIARASSDHATLQIASARLSQDTLQVIMRFEMQDGWHLYWKNPGESGLAPKFKWQVPGLKAIRTHWPHPKRYGNETVMSYAMGDTVYLMTDLLVESPANPMLKGMVKADWLECLEECIPHSADLALAFSIQKNVQRPGASWLNSVLSQQPLPINAATHPNLKGTYGDTLLFNLGVFNPNPDSLYLFNEAAHWYEASTPQYWNKSTDPIQLKIPKSAFALYEPEFKGVLQTITNGVTKYYALDIPISKPTN